MSVRTIESERYRVVDVDTGLTVEEIEASKAFWTVHPGAVYLNQARTFLVKSLDVTEKVARVRRAPVPGAVHRPLGALGRVRHRCKGGAG